MNQTINTSENNPFKPPYLSVPKIDLLLEKISKMSIRRFDNQTVSTLGFSGSDISLAITALKFLGIVNNDGDTNQSVIASFQISSKEKRDSEIQKIIMESYSDLYQILPNAHLASKDDITDSMKITYELSPRVARGAAPAYIFLCQYAGIRQNDDTIQRRAVKEKSSKLVQQKKTRPAEDTTKIESDGGIAILMPNKYLGKMSREGILEIHNAITKFVGSDKEVV